MMSFRLLLMIGCAILLFIISVKGQTISSSTKHDTCATTEICYDPATSRMKAEWSGINFGFESGGGGRGPPGLPGPVGPKGARGPRGTTGKGISIEDIKKEVTEAMKQSKPQLVDSDIEARLPKLEKNVRDILNMPEPKPRIKPNVPLEVPEGEIDILGWVKASNGYEYFISGSVDYEEGKKFCQSKDSSLAVVGIRNSKVLTYLLENFIQKRGVSVWIGLNDTKSEAEWYWEDGVKSTMFNTQWASGNPDGRGDCAFIYYRDGSVKDYSCTSNLRALCER